MGILRNAVSYLVGPIDHCSNRGSHWRKDLIPFLRDLGIRAIDPLDKPIINHIHSEDELWDLRKKLKEEKNYDELARVMKTIRNIDLRFCDKADFIIVNWDPSITMTGTLEELFWSNREKKPIFLHCPQGKDAISDWLYATLDDNFFFDSWETLKQRILDIDNESYPVDSKWVLFKQSFFEDYESIQEKFLAK